MGQNCSELKFLRFAKFNSDRLESLPQVSDGFSPNSLKSFVLPQATPKLLNHLIVEDSKLKWSFRESENEEQYNDFCVRKLSVN